MNLQVVQIDYRNIQNQSNNISHVEENKANSVDFLDRWEICENEECMIDDNIPHH